MLATAVCMEPLAQPSDVVASKKTSHSPWTASKPRKKNRQGDADDFYEPSRGIVESQADENVPPAWKQGYSTSVDVNMLASGFERLRVFRKAAGAKGARQQGPSARRPDWEGAAVESAGAYAGFPSTSFESTLSNGFLSGVVCLRTASEPACRPQPAIPAQFGSDAAKDKADAACTTPGAADSIPVHHNSFSTAGLGAKPMVRPDLTALSAEAILMGPPAPKPWSQPQHQQHQHLHTAAALATHTSPPRPSLVLPPQPLHHHAPPPCVTDVWQPRLSGTTGSHSTASGAGTCSTGSTALYDDDDDPRPFILPSSLCGAVGEEEDDVWEGCHPQQDEDFRIVTRPLRGPSDDGRGPGWDAGVRQGPLFTPSTVHCTPRVLAHRLGAATPASSSQQMLASRRSSGGGAGGCPDSAGHHYMVRHYGRAGQYSGASSTPRPRAARRAPTPAGHLLSRTLEADLEGLEGDADYQEGDDGLMDELSRGRALLNRPTPLHGAQGLAHQAGLCKGVAVTLKAAAKKLVSRLSGSAGLPTAAAACSSPAIPGAGVAAAPSQPQRSVPRVVMFSPGAAAAGDDSDSALPSAAGTSRSGRQPEVVGAMTSRRRMARRVTVEDPDELLMYSGGVGISGRGGAGSAYGARGSTPFACAGATPGGSAQGDGQAQDNDQSLVDLARRKQLEEEALANLMCDECDFCTPPHSPKLHGLPHWHSERRSEMRRTHSADEAMMAREMMAAAPHHQAPHHYNHQAAAARGGGGNMGLPAGTGALGGAGAASAAFSGLHHAASYDMATCGNLLGQWGAGGMSAFGANMGGGGGFHPSGSADVFGSLELAHGMQQHMGLVPQGHLSVGDLYGGGRMAGGHAGGHHMGPGHMEEDPHPSTGSDSVAPPVMSLTTVDEFNVQLSLAAERGDRGRAERLWAELRTQGLLPDMRTLNMLMRCLAKSVIHPDEAEELMCEVCTVGGLQPNATTMTLLAEMRLRYEHLCG